MASFTLPNLGEDIEEADVLRVLVAEGEAVDVDTPLVEIETEKATLDVPSDVKGTVTRILIKPGDVIKVGQPLFEIEAGAGAPASAPPEAPREAAPAPPAEEAAPPKPADAAAEPAEPAAEAKAPETPSPQPERPRAPREAPAAPASAPAVTEGVFAAPSVRKFAREVGVDLGRVTGSGPGGRITEDDVKRAARDRAAAPPQQAAAPAGEPGGTGFERRHLPDFSQWGEVTREPLSRLRRTVARNMAQSWAEIPHVHLYHHADITAMEDLRKQFRDRAKAAGGNLTISVMMLKVVAAALRAHPKFNASLDIDNQELVLKKYVHLGVAVDTDRGLVVPKIEDVDEKNIIQISIELNEIAERARKNELTLEEMRGSTFTVTNLGSLGTGYFDPIINWPEVAVLGLGRAERTAVWDEERERWAPRLIMPLSLGLDHRVIDGADGARFMSWIVEAIKNPLLMAIEG